MGKLIIMSGAPGSGKSFWAQKYIKTHDNTIWVSRDKIRFTLVNEKEEYFSKEREVIKEFYKEINEYLCHYNVIADATHLTEKSRWQLISNIITTPSMITIIQLRPSLEVCLAHNNLRCGRELVPPHIVKSMYQSLTNPINDWFADRYTTIEIIKH